MLFLDHTMRDVIRVLILGTGQMGSGIARLVLEKQGLALVGAFGRRKERAGMDVGRAIGLDRDLGIPLSGDLAGVIEQARPHVAIQATCSRLDDAMDEITTLLRHGVHVISIAEEMAYPAGCATAAADEINALAVANGVGVVGTGALEHIRMRGPAEHGTDIEAILGGNLLRVWRAVEEHAAETLRQG